MPIKSKNKKRAIRAPRKSHAPRPEFYLTRDPQSFGVRPLHCVMSRITTLAFGPSETHQTRHECGFSKPQANRRLKLCVKLQKLFPSAKSWEIYSFVAGQDPLI